MYEICMRERKRGEREGGRKERERAHDIVSSKARNGLWKPSVPWLSDCTAIWHRRILVLKNEPRAQCEGNTSNHKQSGI